MASFRSEFLGAAAPLGAKTQDEWQKDIVRRLDTDLLALAILALREHLKARPSLPHPEPARAATEGERCSPLPSVGGEPSAGEIRAVGKALFAGAWRDYGSGAAEYLTVTAAIRALDEYRARKAKP